MKTCTKCQTAKVESDFYRKDSSRLASECKKCSRERMRVHGKKYYKTNKVRVLKYQNRPDVRERHKDLQLLRTYGISLKQYDAMLDGQGGKCAICLATAPGARSKYFHVDHDHTTGQVRGLLCDACNKMCSEHFEKFHAAGANYIQAARFRRVG